MFQENRSSEESKKLTFMWIFKFSLCPLQAISKLEHIYFDSNQYISRLDDEGCLALKWDANSCRQVCWITSEEMQWGWHAERRRIRPSIRLINEWRDREREMTVSKDPRPLCKCSPLTASPRYEPPRDDCLKCCTEILSEMSAVMKMMDCIDF